MVCSTPRPHFIPGKDPVLILQEGGPQSRSGRAEDLVSTGIRSRTVQLYSFSDLGTLDGGEVQPHAPAASTPGKDPVPIAQEAGWAPGSVWTGAENLVPTGIRSLDRPARSQSL